MTTTTQLTANNILESTFGYSAFRGYQEQIINTLIDGDDALVIMPTGGGKSLCYQIPSIARPGCGVVISPLIALMQDQVDALTELGVCAGFLNSTQPYEEMCRVEQLLKSRQLQVLYIAPERLKQDRTLQLLLQSEIALFAIDEAHCVSQWGHDFRSDYLQLHRLAELFPYVPRVALTATADARTQQEIAERLCLKQAQSFIAGFDRPNIFYQIMLKQNPKQQLLQFVQQEHESDAGIIYCLSRRKTEDIAQWLSGEGFTALPYHAGLSHQQRVLNQQRFLREEGIIIVATIAFGMGIDKPDVRFVAHLDLPKSIEAYYQETGRAGRDGQPASAWMVYGLEDVIKLREMMGASVSVNEATAEYKRIEYQKLEAMLGLCEITSCRRHALLSYFGDNASTACGYCDMCKTPAVTWEGTEAAQKAISCAYRTEQRFGVSYLIDILRGANTEKIKQNNHQALSVYGIGKALTQAQWRSVYRQLIARGFLQVDFNQFNRIVLTESCRPLLKGEVGIEFRQDPVSSSTLRKTSKNKYTNKHADLWDALRECRLRLAKERNVPPYVVFHDSVLMQMIELMPLTVERFSILSGVGETKQKQYAQAFVDVITKHQRESRQEISDTLQETYTQLKEGESPESIAKQRQLALSTIFSHAGHLIRLEKLHLKDVVTLDEKEIVLIESTFIDLDMLTEPVKLKPAFDALSEAYHYNA